MGNGEWMSREEQGGERNNREKEGVRCILIPGFLNLRN